MVVIQNVHIGDEFVDKRTNKIGEVVGIMKRDENYIITLQCENGEDLLVDLTDLEEVRYTLTPQGILCCILLKYFPENMKAIIWENSKDIFEKWVDSMEKNGYLKKPDNE